MIPLSSSSSSSRPDIWSCSDSRRNFLRRRDRFACSLLRSRRSVLCFFVRSLSPRAAASGVGASPLPSVDDCIASGGASPSDPAAFRFVPPVVVASGGFWARNSTRAGFDAAAAAAEPRAMSVAKSRDTSAGEPKALVPVPKKQSWKRSPISLPTFAIIEKREGRTILAGYQNVRPQAKLDLLRSRCVSTEVRVACCKFHNQAHVSYVPN
mmetsp:Transcript_17804/g.35545  ORF Transcript_17804/g.35545 Transcript_17804/m.35545 type:complete len:210 (-) Transcript_17804:14-643(-)